MAKSKTPTYDKLSDDVRRIIDTKTDSPEGREAIAKRVKTTLNTPTVGTGH